MSANRGEELERVKQTLLRERTWRYLRYQHLREGFLLARNARTVHCVGAGKAYAELALALEFPDVHFHITDIESERTPNFGVAVSWAKKLGLSNVSFDTFDVFDLPDTKWDLVTSIETLEHIEDDVTAAKNMLKMANQFVFALVPFAHKAANADPARRKRVWETHGHYRVGYDEDDLAALFSNSVEVRGCYWGGEGRAFRHKLTSLSNEEIDERASDLLEEAKLDIRLAIPKAISDASGIWTLARSS